MSKEKIFALLSAQAGDFVSGEDISAQLGISRAAVWKAVGALRRDGYTIEAQTGLGYRLADSPDVLSERELRRRLGETKIVGRTLECFESVDSTNSYLKRIAAEGAPDGAVAFAREQSAEVRGVRLAQLVIDKGAAQLIVNDVAARPEAEHQPAAAYDGGKLLLVNAVSLHE